MELFGDREVVLMESRLRTFGMAAGSLRCCRLDADDGSVSSMVHIRSYIDRWKDMRRENIGLLLWGPPGTGKTFAAACVANALLEREDGFPPRVIMATFGTILRQLLAQSPQEKEEYIRNLLECDLLILDDLGMERQTEYAREQVFSIVDGRIQAANPMIVTTNLTLNQLRSPGTLEEQRIYDRVLGCCVPICFQGESRRPAQGAGKMLRFRQITGGAD